MGVSDLSSPSTPSAGRKAVLFFWAAWHEVSNRGGPLDAVLGGLATAVPSIDFYRVEAEEESDLSEKYNVEVVPTFVLIDEEGKIIQTLSGCTDVSQVTQAVSAFSKLVSSETKEEEKSAEEETKIEELSLDKRLDQLIHSSTVMLFMKGTPTGPRCGFSRQIVEILKEHKIPFGSFDILTDEDVRQGLKNFSNWPTYPQLYVKGELMGGLDIIKEMIADDKTPLADQLGISLEEETKMGSNEEKTMTLDERLAQLVRRHRVMLFMKGLPSAPRCGFSRKIVELLEKEGTAYDSFDILQDEEVRQGLKTFSDWPTYPQLYVDGELMGGLDIVKEMAENGELKEMFDEIGKQQ